MLVTRLWWVQPWCLQVRVVLRGHHNRHIVMACGHCSCALTCELLRSAGVGVLSGLCPY